MSILVKAGTGLVAGVVAGALGLAFFPRVEPTALKPRSAVEKPQFVAAPGSTPPAVAATRAAPAVAIASEEAPPAPAPAEKPVAPPKPAQVAAAPEVKPAPAAKPVAEAKPAPVALASVDAPKLQPVTPRELSPLGEPRSISFASPPQPAPSLAETRATAAAAQPAAASAPTGNDVSARWSVRGLVALAKGDLSSARLYLTRAAEAGDPRALVALADTYDPAMLAKLGVVVAPGDAQRARDYLIKAAAAGVLVAKDRMAALDSDAASTAH